MSRISSRLTTLSQLREQRQRNSEATLRKLSRQLAALSAQHAELSAAHSSARHASEIARLDTQKFRIAKACSDAEMEGERLAGQLADAQARLQELEMQGVDGGVGDGDGGAASDSVDDEVLLRLKVYRDLGIVLERDAESGEYVKAVIRNDRKGDVHVVNMDPKFSRFFYANYFWSMM